MSRYHWAAPLCGAVFVVTALVAIGLSPGEGLDPANNTTAEIVKDWSEHDTPYFVSALMTGVAAILLLFFAGWMRQLLHKSAGDDSILPTVSFAALVVLVAGIGVGASIQLALAANASDLDPSAVAALSALNYDYFIPFAIGMIAFLLSTGIAVLKYGALPRPYGWVAIGLAVLFLGGPVGIVGFLGGQLWILVVSIRAVLGREERAAAPAPATG